MATAQEPGEPLLLNLSRLDGIRLASRAVMAVLLMMLLVHAVNVYAGGALLRYGIVPRQPELWYQVLSAPFVHASHAHLLNNLLGLAIFGLLCALRSLRLFLFGSALIILVSGALVWTFGRDASHIGASGWVFGLWSLCIALGFLDRRLSSVLLSVAVIGLYGGMAYGVLPGDPRVSFESHLFGAVAGVLAAWAYVRLRKRRAAPR